MEKIYFTVSGLKEVEKEYQTLLELRKEKIRGKHPEILHSEDINPEYLSYIEDADLLDVKLADLDYIIKHAEILKPPPKEEQGIVALGAKVILENKEKKDEFEIVNTFEANPMKGKISVNSFLGKNLLGHKAGEEIKGPNNNYKIKKITYQHLTD